jgi:Endonuclease/Exonuclease/phosphatase family
MQVLKNQAFQNKNWKALNPVSLLKQDPCFNVGIEAGRLLPMYIEESQVHGSALVTAIDDCPDIAPDVARVANSSFVDLGREVKTGWQPILQDQRRRYRSLMHLRSPDHRQFAVTLCMFATTILALPKLKSRKSHMHCFRKEQLSTLLIIAFCSLIVPSWACGQLIKLAPPKAENSIRVATFKVSMNRSATNRLTEDLQRSDAQIKLIATIIRAVKPDVILLNEIDYSTETDNAKLFEQKYLSDPALDALGNGPHAMPHQFSAPVNTGDPSGMDLNNNQRTNDPEDAWGFGRFPGQYGMAVLSRFEIDAKATRTFQNLLWSKLPNASRPIDPQTGQAYYNEATWEKLRLPSKSLWDVSIKANGKLFHMLASHPTPPSFDGPEDRNGCRNHDEVRLLLDYISAPQAADTNNSNLESYWKDDQGRPGRLPQQEQFIIAGDLNCDPVDGDSRSDAIRGLLSHARVQSNPTPQSEGGIAASKQQANKNLDHRGNPQFDTSDFNDQVVGNLRVDYVLPSIGFKVKASGVVWPKEEQDNPAHELLRSLNGATDHHMVWVDVEL